MFLYNETVNITIRGDMHKYDLLLTAPPTHPHRWQDMAPSLFKVGSPSTHTHGLIYPNYQVPAANITLASIFHQSSLFGIMRAMLSNQASHKHFFCVFSVWRQKNHQFTSLEELNWWRMLRKACYSMCGRSWTTDLTRVMSQAVCTLKLCKISYKI